MAVKKTVVCGIFQSAELAKQAAAEFVAAGFPKQNVITETDSEAKTGGIKLSVHTDTSEQVTQAEELLKKTGAEDVSTVDETREIFVET